MLMKIKCILPALAAASLLAACNNDIFIDGEVPESVTVEIEGDGGTVEVPIVRKGLMSIVFDDVSDPDKFVTTYGHSGTVIPNESSLDEIARINFTSRYLIFDIYVEGDRLRLHSTECTGYIGSTTLRLDYGYDSAFITVRIAPGREPELAFFAYDMTRLDDPGPRIHETFSLSYNNEGPLPSSVTVWPYLNSFCRVTLEPVETWFDYLTIGVPLPLYSETAGWQVSDKVYAVKTGTNFDFSLPGIDRMLHIDGTVPALSQGSVRSFVESRWATVPFTMTIRNPVSGREYDSEGICTVKQPLSYEVVLE